MADPRPDTRTLCTRCGDTLHRRSCGCWVSANLTRWCADRHRLHRPHGSTQPERCPGTPPTSQGDTDDIR